MRNPPSLPSVSNITDDVRGVLYTQKAETEMAVKEVWIRPDCRAEASASTFPQIGCRGDPRMSSQMGSRMNTYGETIEGLKKELEPHVVNLRSATEWADFVRLYRALCTIEELENAPKTSLEELLGIAPANAPAAS